MNANPIVAEGRDRVARVDLAVYTLEVVLKSAYRFTGRCYLHLQQSGSVVEVRMRPKQEQVDPDVPVREFFNDLLDQRLRGVLASETAEVRNLIMAHALSRADLVRPELTTAEPTADPFHVSRPDRKSVATP